MHQIDIDIPRLHHSGWQQLIDNISIIFDAELTILSRFYPGNLKAFIFGGKRKNSNHIIKNNLFSLDSIFFQPLKENDFVYISESDIRVNEVHFVEQIYDFSTFFGIPILWPNGDGFGTLSVINAKVLCSTLPCKEILFDFKYSVELGLKLIEANRTNQFVLEAKNRVENEYRELMLECGKIKMSNEKELENERKKQQHNEDKYRLIVENQNALIVKFDSKKRLLFASPQYCKVFGKTEEDLLGKTFFPLIHPDDLEAVKKSNESLKFPPHECSHQEREMTVDGWRWFSWSNKAILKPDGTIDEIVAVGQDITAKKSAELALIESEEKNRALSETTTEALIFIIANICVECNKASCKMFGYSYNEMIGLDASKLIEHSEQNKISKYLKGLTKEPFEALGCRKDGTKFLSEFSNGSYDYKGSKVIVGAIRDISQKKIAEEALRLSEEKFRVSFKINPDSIIINRLSDGLFIEINSGFTKLSGYTEGDVLKKNTLDINLWVNPEDRQKFRTELLKNGSVVNFDAPLRTKEGNIYIGLISASIISIQEEPCIISITRNIQHIKETEKKIQDQNIEYQLLNEELTQLYKELFTAKEKAVESDKLKTAFLANMSHEIRTPMNGIIGFANLLGKDVDEEKRNKYIEIIQSNSNHLLNIINDLVDISKIEAGQIDIDLVTVNLDELTQCMANLYKPKSLEGNIGFETKNTEMGIEVLADKSKLEQIFVNLIDNAFKFTETGLIVFGYGINENEIEFYVSDTGIGIDPVHHSSIFERFRQVDLSSIRKYGGTGLGLSISKAYIEKMGGRIWVDSELGNGSTFYFSLPIQFIRKVQTKLKALDPIVNNLDWSKHTILVAEDEPLNFHFFEEILEETRVVLLWVKNGKEAVNICRERNDIDLVLMDIKMPEMNGYDATREIKKFKPTLPIIAQTAYALIGDESKARDAGCDGYIQKPINYNILMKLLAGHLDGR